MVNNEKDNKVFSRSKYGSDYTYHSNIQLWTICYSSRTMGEIYMKCWVCNEELVWGGDHDLEEDETHFGGNTMITNLSCQNCNAYVEVYHGGESNE